jgi:hypothetical protein
MLGAGYATYQNTAKIPQTERPSPGMGQQPAKLFMDLRDHKK